MDAVRGTMALLVFYHHIRQLFFADYRLLQSPSLLVKICYFFSGLGHLAVMIFFVLSGFFIGSSVLKAVRSGSWSFRWYAVQRLSRLLVVLAPALCIGACLDLGGIALFGNVGAYAAGHQYQYLSLVPVKSLISLRIALGNLFFLQWIKVPCLGSNGPLWSLSYEFWYYVMFPLFLLAALRRYSLPIRLVLATIGICILVFLSSLLHGEPAIYFLIWLMGALIAALPVRCVATALARVGSVSCMVLLLAAVIYWRLKNQGPSGDFCVSICFAGLMYFLRQLHHDTHSCNPTYKRTATFMSGISYSLYLLHQPALFFLNAYLVGQGLLWHMDSRHVVLALFAAALTLGYVLIVWSATEAKTKQVRTFVEQCVTSRCSN